MVVEKFHEMLVAGVVRPVLVVLCAFRLMATRFLFCIHMALPVAVVQNHHHENGEEYVDGHPKRNEEEGVHPDIDWLPVAPEQHATDQAEQGCHGDQEYMNFGESEIGGRGYLVSDDRVDLHESEHQAS